MDFLKNIIGNELFEQLKSKIDEYNGDEANKDKQIKIGNLGGGDYVSKHKYGDLETLFNSKSQELTDANKLIADMKKDNKDNEELQNKIKAYETQVGQLQSQLKQTQLDAAVNVALLEAKANDIEYMTYKLKQGGELELDEKGKVKGIDEKINSLKTQYPAQFTSNDDKGEIELHELPDSEHEKAAPQSLAEALQMKYEAQ